MGFDLGSFLSRFTRSGTAATACDHAQQVAHAASPDRLSQA